MSTENDVSTASLPKQEQSINSNSNTPYNRNSRSPRPDNRGPRTEDRVRNGVAYGSTGGSSGGGFSLVLKNPYKVQRIRVLPEPVVARPNRRDSSRSSTDSKDDENRRNFPRNASSDVSSAGAFPKRKSTTAVTTGNDVDASESSNKYRPGSGSSSNGRYFMTNS